MHTGLKQNVNQWLCIALVSLMCFWTVLFYFTNKAQALGEDLVTSLDQNI